jgi:hypothetical protein
MDTPDLLTEIDAFLAETGIKPAYFGKRACGNSELVRRLRDKGRVWPETEQKVRQFMQDKRSQRMAAE